nr:PREDICTED: proteasome subunit alpha type-7-like [Struthio camelus australis]
MDTVVWETDIRANIICNNAKTVHEFLEKHHREEATATHKDTMKLAIRAVLEIFSAKDNETQVAEREKEEEESEKKKKKNI